MEFLADETYTSSDGQQTSRNIWYGSADITTKGEFGMVIKLNDDLKYSLCKIISDDLNKNAGIVPTETNWYFYGSGITKESIGNNILPAIMIRKKAGEFVSNISVNDYDFSISIDAIVSFKKDFEHCLHAINGTSPNKHNAV